MSNPNRFFVSEGSVRYLKSFGNVRTLYYYLMSDIIVFAVNARDWKAQKFQVYDTVVKLPGCWISILDEQYGKYILMSFIE